MDITNLAAGAHAFTVIATDAASLVGMAKISWVVALGAGQNVTFSPPSGGIGTLITLTGVNFDLSSLTSVMVGGVPAIVVNFSANSAQILVMPGTVTGNIVGTTATANFTSQTPFSMTAAQPVSTQQGPKLVGSGNVGAAGQGHSVALSADGNTAIVGAPGDNSNLGAAWVFTRSGTAWMQQAELVGTGNAGAARQGFSVALSADGNTAIVGGPGDNTVSGAAWVFTRSGTTWTQQQAKLVGTGNVGGAQQGFSVALSADGNTALVGGSFDNTQQGAVLGVHAKRDHLDPAGGKTCRYG